MFAVVMIVVLASMGMLLMRAFMGSSAFDRILALNGITTHVIVFIVLLGLFRDTEFFIDVSLVYALVGFITTIGFLMYFKYKPDE